MYWDNTNSNTVKVSDAVQYENFPHMTSTIPEQYNCDPLQPSSVVFMGSCDLDGPITDTTQVWARLIHTDLVKQRGPFPYIALGKMTAGMISMPRRLLTFCEKYGPPKEVFAVIPRPVAIEIPMLNGDLASVSNRKGFSYFLHNNGKISDEELQTLLAAVQFSKAQFVNVNYHIYQFEQSASFLKVICERYNIDFKWTLNLSASACSYYQRFFTIFMDNCPYMTKSFVGLGVAKDFGFDGSMGDNSQHSVHQVFVNPPDGRHLSILQQNAQLAMQKTNKEIRSMEE